MAISRLQNDVYTIAFRYKKKKFMFILVLFWWRQ